MDGLVVGLPSQFVMSFSAVVQRSARRVAMFRPVKKTCLRRLTVYGGVVLPGLRPNFMSWRG